MKRYLLLPLLAFIGFLAAVGYAQVGETTGTVTACAAVTTPPHVVGVDGNPVYTVPSETASDCNTVTYTVPTVTVTTDPSPPPPPPPPIDTTPPAKPVLSLGPVTQTSMTLNWQPGVDNIGVDHYNVYLNGNKLIEVGPLVLSYTYTGLTCGTSYAQGLTVEDVAGNTSNLNEATWTRSTAACDQPPPPPPPSSFPDESNTGPVGILEESFGNRTITQAGTIIENLRIHGCIVVQANNIIIRNSEIVDCVGWSVNTVPGNFTGTLIVDVKIVCFGRPGDAGVTNKNYTIRRSEVTNCENGLWSDGNVTIEDNYIHDMIPYDPVTDPHTDSIQGRSPATNTRIVHNTVFGGYINQQNFGNSAIGIAANAGDTVTNVVVNNNLLAGGGYTLYCPGQVSGFAWNNNRFTRRYVFTVGGFGPIYHTCPQHPHTGNVIHETGEPVG